MCYYIQKRNPFNFQLILCIGLVIEFLSTNKQYSAQKNVLLVKAIDINLVSERTFAIYFYIYANTSVRFKFQFGLMVHSGRKQKRNI